jgi:hypothetical protein
MFDVQYAERESDLSAPLLSILIQMGWNWHLSCGYASREVVKASTGHNPQPFLISYPKNCCKGNGNRVKFAKKNYQTGVCYYWYNKKEAAFAASPMIIGDTLC